uniref:Uncharacterized protein n=1 Tax=Rhizophagus irregularis (strain DAOM 181602 / DAOM 197198 / MUCL 43194) TaxID=747089 RepID=U9UUK3_RHIID
MIQKVAFEVSQLEKIAQNRSIKGLDINNEDYDNSDEKNDKFFIELKDTLFDINGNLIVLNLIKIRQSHNAFLQVENIICKLRNKNINISNNSCKIIERNVANDLI